VEGSGLGLSLTKRLVEAMAGTIEVDSEPDRGSTFRIGFPLVEGQVERYQRLQVPAGGEVDHGPRGTVLYIEDNPSNLRLVRRVLQLRPGVTLASAMQGREGLELASTLAPDLILLDLDLPDVDGEEVLGRLRLDRQTSEIPVVVVTADVAAGRRTRLLAQGARGYLTKPLDVRAFLATLDGVLATHSRLR
jgi:CheY-like chemotaxis protein